MLSSQKPPFLLTLFQHHHHYYHHHHRHHHQSLLREGRWCITDDFATTFLHFSLFSTALWDLPNTGPVHSLMLSSRLFLCLPYLLPPFTVPRKMVLARPDERETWPYHSSLRLFTIVRRSSCGPIRADVTLLHRSLTFVCEHPIRFPCNLFLPGIKTGRQTESVNLLYVNKAVTARGRSDLISPNSRQQ